MTALDDDPRARTRPDAVDEGDGGHDLAAPETRATGRWGPSVGVPVAKSKDFGSAVRRLAGLLAPQRAVLIVIAIAAISSAVLNVLGPRLLGHATDVLVTGVIGGGIDRSRLNGYLLEATGVYVGSTLLSILVAYLLAGVVQRLMFDLRTSAEEKVHALPLGYIDRQQRGDLLSRVTNDLDNLAQSLQQTLSQMLTSVLLLVGVGAVMFTISPLLAVVALTTVPLSVWSMRFVAARARPRFISQWGSTGALNAQVEETFTGHAIVKSFGRQGEVEARFETTNDQLFESSFGAQFMSSLMQPLTMFVGNLQ
ncbi:MAG: ABC transporter ATP-binding protein, partial [Acidimicrobiales bacterium]